MTNSKNKTLDDDSLNEPIQWNITDYSTVFSLLTGQIKGLKSLPSVFRKNKEVVMLAMSDGNNLKYVSKKLRDDKEVVLTSLRHYNPKSVEYISDRLKRDRDVILLAFKDLNVKLDELSEELRDDEELVHKFIMKNPENIQFVSDRLRDDKQFISNLIKKKCVNSNSFSFFSKRLQNDNEIIDLIKSLDNCLQYFSEEMRDDEKIVIPAIMKQLTCLKYVSSRLLNDKEFILKILSIVEDHRNILSLVPTHWKKDKDFIRKLKIQNPSVIINAIDYHLLFDTCFITEMCKLNPSLVYPLSTRISSNKQLILSLLHLDRSIYKNMDVEHTKDFSIMLRALELYEAANKRLPSTHLMKIRRLAYVFVKKTVFLTEDFLNAHWLRATDYRHDYTPVHACFLNKEKMKCVMNACDFRHTNCQKMLI